MTTPEPRSEGLSAQHLELFIRQMAEQLSDIRKMKRLLWEHRQRVEHIREWPSTEQEMRDDWNEACSLLALTILEDTDLQIAHLEPASFPHVEAIWLSDAKRLRAYYIWEEDDTGTPEGNYLKACQEIRHALCGRASASPEDFQRVRSYLETSYLHCGKIDESKAPTVELIQRKAYRIWESTGNPDAIANWHRAKSYVRLFYENIVPAVVDEDETAITAVLKAFQYGKAPHAPYLIKNCFEAAIAIEFLNKVKVGKIIESPEAYAFGMVPVDDWPAGKEVSANGFRYAADERQILFDGVMTEQKENELLSQLTEERHQTAIRHLYQQSRLRPAWNAIL